MKYCGGQGCSGTPYQAAARSVKFGSVRCGRASATRSARPAARMVLTWSAVVMLPTHIVATRASFRIWSEKGVWNIRPKTGRDDRVGLPGGDVDEVDAGLREGLGDVHRVVAGDAAIGPVGRRDADRHRLRGRPRLAHPGEHLEGEAQPVLDRPAVLVLAPVGERRDEAREQVAVGAMELDHVEADARRSLHRRHEFPDDPVHVVARRVRAAPGSPGSRG